MKCLTAKQALSDEEVEALAGDFLTDQHYSVLLQEDADVFRADGTPLLHFRKRQVPERHAGAALKALYEAATEYGNRGIAAGKLKYHDPKSNRKLAQGRKAYAIDESGVRFKYIKEDGSLSKTNIAITVPSGIVGAFDRQPRFPYCRLSKFTAEHPERIKAAMPFVKAVNGVFQTQSPLRYQAQLAQCNRTHPDYVFKGTAFTTITVNKNWRTACHQDAGDLKAGFGVMSVLTEGRYEGGYFIIPKYALAVDMRHTDVLLADVHEWHGNSEIFPVSKYWTRLSTVFYFRSKIVGCKALTSEIEIAKRRREGQPMYADFNGEFPE